MLDRCSPVAGTVRGIGTFYLEPAKTSRVVKQAHLCQLPKNQVMAAAVAGGTVTVRKAMAALGQLGQVEHLLAPGEREEALASLTLMAQTGHDRNVIAVGRRLMSLVGADPALDRWRPDRSAEPDPVVCLPPHQRPSTRSDRDRHRLRRRLAHLSGTVAIFASLPRDPQLSSARLAGLARRAIPRTSSTDRLGRNGAPTGHARACSRRRRTRRIPGRPPYPRPLPRGRWTS